MRRCAKSRCYLLGAAALMLAGIRPARAYFLESTAWASGTPASPHQITMQIELGSTGPANKTLIDGDTTWDQVAVDAMNDWNSFLPTVQFKPVTGSTATVGTTQNPNGTNTVSWSTTVFGEAWGQGVVGLTFTYSSGPTENSLATVETDVFFNSNPSWDSYRGNLRAVYDLRRVALHEFGHALGLNHPNDAGQTVSAIMNSVVGNLDDLTVDDKAGVNYLYALAPTITSQPTSQTAAPGTSPTFTVGTSFDPYAAQFGQTSTGAALSTLQWQFNSAAISGATQSTLTLSSVTTSQQGGYRAVVTNRAGSATSNAATLIVASGPSISTSPSSQSVTTGGALTLTVGASGTGLTYQWDLNGTAISGATSSTYSLTNTGATDAGSYTVVVSSGSTSTTSAAAVVTVTTTSRLINLSTLANTGSGGLTEGFSVGGSGNKNLLIRGIGPALSGFSVANYLTNPILTLNTTGATNAGWGGSSTLANAFSAVGAFSLPANSADSALLAALQGTATATVVGSGGAQGNALLEVYDRDALTAPARLVNLSVIDSITAGNSLSGGFVISGSSSMTVLIRGVGPGLATLGVPAYTAATVMAQPKLVVNLTSPATVVATNTGWDGTAKSSAVFAQVGAFALTPGSADSVAIVTLAPGQYSAVVSGVNNSAGSVLVEIYEVR